MHTKPCSITNAVFCEWLHPQFVTTNPISDHDFCNDTEVTIPV